MKNHFVKRQIAMLAATAAIVLTSGCATETASNGNSADTEMEHALLASGFKVRPASTATQRNGIATMADNQFEVVHQNGNEYYIYADKRDSRLYVGDRYAYRAYQGFVRNNHLRKQGVFVFETHPGDRANNQTVDVYNGYPPFREW
jgi:hypothetical protein